MKWLNPAIFELEKERNSFQLCMVFRSAVCGFPSNMHALCFPRRIKEISSFFWKVIDAAHHLCAKPCTQTICSWPHWLLCTRDTSYSPSTLSSHLSTSIYILPFASLRQTFSSISTCGCNQISFPRFCQVSVVILASTSSPYI